MYLMKKSLAPLQVINDTVKTIEVNRLDNRIALSDDKNELHELAVSINQALDRIEYGYKQQQQFISDASHELRTPITVIAGYADLLCRWGKEDPAVLNESLAAIKSETDYMKQLIERLNRTFRESYRITCGYGTEDGACHSISLWVAYYNFLRPHAKPAVKTRSIKWSCWKLPGICPESGSC